MVFVIILPNVLAHSVVWPVVILQVAYALSLPIRAMIIILVPRIHATV